MKRYHALPLPTLNAWGQPLYWYVWDEEEYNIIGQPRTEVMARIIAERLNKHE